MNIVTALLFLPGLMIGLTVHECAHAWSASLLGDDLARRHGRVSLNPFRHLSLLGTMAIFLLPIGWAKPVPVNLYHFKHPRRDYLLTSLAGPAANVLMAALLIAMMYFTRRTYSYGPGAVLWLAMAHQMLTMGVVINAILATINLLPIPPLDGSKIWPVLLPRVKPAFKPKTMLISMILLVVLLQTKSLQPLLNRVLDGTKTILPVSDAARFGSRRAMAAVAMEHSEYALAEQSLTLAVEINPYSVSAYYGRAMARVALDKPAEALADLDKVIALYGRWPDPGRCVIGDLAIDSGDYVLAEQLFDRAVAFEPDSAAAYYGRAKARIVLGKPAEALADLDKAIGLRAFDPDYHELRASLYEQTGDTEQAAADRKKAQELRPLVAEIEADIHTPPSVVPANKE